MWGVSLVAVVLLLGSCIRGVPPGFDNSDGATDALVDLGDGAQKPADVQLADVNADVDLADAEPSPVGHQDADGASDSGEAHDAQVSQPDAAAACGGCPAGLDCVEAVCTCKEGGSCGGCCTADRKACIDPPTTDECGGEGTECFSCPVGKANRCFRQYGGHCACSTATHDGPGLPPACGSGQTCDLTQEECVAD